MQNESVFDKMLGNLKLRAVTMHILYWGGSDNFNVFTIFKFYCALKGKCFEIPNKAYAER